jgi:hypothetical protein
MLQNVLCGFADTLYRHFPAEAALSLLPSPEQLRIIDVDSAFYLAKSLRWANSNSQKLPLVPLRLHTPLQVSNGPWHRIIRDIAALRTANPDLDAETNAELSRAERMKAWIIDQCNIIHLQWNVSIVDEKPLLEVLDTMAGEKIPDWLPVRVRFEAEDGEMAMKLDYENRTESYSERYALGKRPRTRAPQLIETGQQWQREDLDVQELPFRVVESETELSKTGVLSDNTHENACLSPRRSTRPADFLHSTGRNLCSTSGWWPDTSKTSTVLLDSTHEVSAPAHESKVQP